MWGTQKSGYKETLFSEPPGFDRRHGLSPGTSFPDNFLVQFRTACEKAPAEPAVSMPSEPKAVSDAGTSAASQGLPSSLREGNPPGGGTARAVPVLPRMYGNAIPLGQQLALAASMFANRPAAGIAFNQDVAPQGAKGAVPSRERSPAMPQVSPWGPAPLGFAAPQQRDPQRDRPSFVDHVVGDIRKAAGAAKQAASAQEPLARPVETAPRGVPAGSAAAGPSEEVREKADEDADAGRDPRGDRPSPRRDSPRAPARSPAVQAVPPAQSSGPVGEDGAEQLGRGQSRSDDVDAPQVDPVAKQEGVRSGSPASEGEERLDK